MLVFIITCFQAKALAEKNMRDMLAQREQAERHVRHLSIKRKMLFLCLYLTHVQHQMLILDTEIG
jgi:hypothetical protein